MKKLIKEINWIYNAEFTTKEICIQALNICNDYAEYLKDSRYTAKLLPYSGQVTLIQQLAEARITEF